MRIPLFPLKTVLFPGGPLQLRVFEQRYLEMVSECLRKGTVFGICLIREGEEVGNAAVPESLGTLARISDWEQRPDGLLGVTVTGDRRFRIRDYHADRQQLLHADVDLLDEVPPQPVPERFSGLQGLLRRILEQLDGPYRQLQPQYEDAGWVSHRLAEILPLPLAAKQRLLAEDDPMHRLEALEQLIKRQPMGG